MLIKKFKKSTGQTVYLMEERYNDPAQTEFKRYKENGAPFGNKSFYIKRDEIVDTKEECEVGK